MKKSILMMSVAVFMLASCSDDKLPDVRPTETGTVTDDNGNSYGWVRIGDLDWTTSNAKNGTLASELTYWTGYSWDDAMSDEEKEDFNDNFLPVYGNLMDYENAIESAPEGWRLPTDEDWQNLERTLGMKNTDRFGFRGDGVAYKMRESENGCGLGLEVAGLMVMEAVYGWKELSLSHTQNYGFYWTSTKGEPMSDGTERAFYRKICSTYGAVDREVTATVDVMMSVRWVRDAK